MNRLALVGLLCSVAASCGGDAEVYSGPRIPLKVMTRNLYLGSDITDVVLSPTVQEVPGRAAAFWANVVRSDIPARAKLLADEIAANAPDLVGLQEVELFRQQTPSDFDTIAGVNATLVAFDFLTLLLAELTTRGLAYTTVVENVLSDVELPTALPGGGLMDVRMTDRDVILAKAGVVTAAPIKGTFANFLAVNVGGLMGPRVEVKRGYAFAQVTVTHPLGQAQVVFGNSHLEIGGALRAFQEPQADELVRTMRALAGTQILVGDFNSPAEATGTRSLAPERYTRSYGFLRRFFDDAYETLKLPDPGFTCCMDIYAPAGPVGVDERIDLVLTRGDVAAIDAVLVGGVARTEGGITASDHRGLVMTLGLVPNGAK